LREEVRLSKEGRDFDRRVGEIEKREVRLTEKSGRD
jgi:hypothetical protein